MAETSELIEISEVATRPAEGLAGAEVNAPTAGDRLKTYALDVRGWAVGQDDPVTAVELRSEGAAVRTVPLEVERPHVAARFDSAPGPSVGFRALVNALALPPEFELEVVAVTQDRAHNPVAVVKGRRAELPAQAGSGLQPLIVTTLGRTGSMLLLRLLEAHPEVLVLRPHRYEQRVAGYWIEVLLTLTDPSSYMRQLAPAGSLDRPRWWLGDEGPTPGFDPETEIQRWLGSDAVTALAVICRERIDALYAEAASEHPGAPRYFAEKHTLQSAALTSELYPESREVFLVRDFRDMVTSILAFNRKRGVRGFGEGASDGAVDYVDRLAGWADGLVRRFARRQGRAHLLRYEDLVRDPRPTLAALLEYLEVDPGEGAVARMLEATRTEMPELARHTTSADPAASVGRWVTELDDDLKRACDRSFGAALETFGYS
jgi:sulfotransferase family protein